MAAAVAAVVAPLLQLKRAAQKAAKLARFARALELHKRTLAAAELALPRDALSIAALLDQMRITHRDMTTQANDDKTLARALGAESIQMIVRSFQLLHARWQAGSFSLPRRRRWHIWRRTSIRVCLRKCAARTSTSVRQMT